MVVGEKFTLPDRPNAPSELSERTNSSAISSNIRRELLLPKESSSLWVGRFGTVGMTVPKTTMHKDSHAQLREYKVGRAR